MFNCQFVSHRTLNDTKNASHNISCFCSHKKLKREENSRYVLVTILMIFIRLAHCKWWRASRIVQVLHESECEYISHLQCVIRYFQKGVFFRITPTFKYDKKNEDKKSIFTKETGLDETNNKTLIERMWRTKVIFDFHNWFQRTKELIRIHSDVYAKSGQIHREFEEIANS